MTRFAKLISVLFHPLFAPLAGVLFYFVKTPRFIPFPIIKAKVFSIIILTFVLPVLILYLLKTINRVASIHLKTTQERKLPLMLYACLLLLILMRVFPLNEIPELYFFFLGILCSNLACLILIFLKFKASIHVMAVSGFLMFAIALAIHFKININAMLVLISIILGAVATARLHLKAHTFAEINTGFFLGLIPQLILLNFWL